MDQSQDDFLGLSTASILLIPRLIELRSYYGAVSHYVISSTMAATKYYYSMACCTHVPFGSSNRGPIAFARMGGKESGVTDSRYFGASSENALNRPRWTPRGALFYAIAGSTGHRRSLSRSCLLIQASIPADNGLAANLRSSTYLVRQNTHMRILEDKQIDSTCKVHNLEESAGFGFSKSRSASCYILR